MTLSEYEAKVDEYQTKMNESYEPKEWDKLYEELSQFQYGYMMDVVNKYSKTVDSKAKEEIYDILYYAVHSSQSGSVVAYVDSEDLASEIDDIIEDEIGEYMLDHPEIYEDEEGRWVINCMFGGAYVPYWDGWGN